MEKVTLIRVIDGDTLIIQYHNIPIVVRLAYIDCFERNNTRKTPTYTPAKNLVLSLLEENQGNIFVNFLGVDKYRRHIAEVFINKKNVAIELLKQGLGYYSIKYFNIIEDYFEAENQARQKRLGIWKQ